MAAGKKPVKKATNGKGKLDAVVAVEFALKVLDSPVVDKTVDRASQVVKAWAANARERQRLKRERRQRESTAPAGEITERPKGRFGQKGLEHRAAELRAAAKAAFPDPASEPRVEMERALDEIDRYLAVVGRLPLVKRKQGHWKTDNLLDDLELGLVRALEPRPR